jgi:DNA mismatch repair protein MutL
MNTIHLLDEITINKIAAGEVIERPASVVKELMENSIDAGATDVRVEVMGNGIQSIKVTDNGHGMSKDDASIAFLKHATSKITDIHDIENVRTLGFRGEALSSITAVAKVTIVTRQQDDLEGTKLVIYGGEVKSIGEAGGAKGTSILVEDLFFNTPARKKFLKKGRTELAHIVDIVTKLALSHSTISVFLSHDGRELLRSAASAQLFDTIVHIYGPQIARELLQVHFTSDLLEISGYISKPGFTRSDRDYQVFFVNGRPVSSKAIRDGVMLGYYAMLPKSRYPVAVLDIFLDTAEVDVNIHPTKQQVRFSHEIEVIDTVAEAMRAALAGHELIPSKDKPVTQTQLYTDVHPQVIREVQSGFKVSRTDTNRKLKRSERYLAEIGDRGDTTEPRTDVQILGQVDEVYIIARTGDGIMIIDQHAAHERIMYEQVLDSKITGSQELITPVNLELDAKEKVLIEEYIPYLEDSGFSISEFGPDSYAVTAVPTILGKLEDPGVVHDVIADILAIGRIKDDTGLFDRVSKIMSCRGAIKAGALLTQDQMENLVVQLYQSNQPHTCPHGRPTIVLLSRDDLDKMFKRI